MDTAILVLVVAAVMVLVAAGGLALALERASRPAPRKGPWAPEPHDSGSEQ